MACKEVETEIKRKKPKIRKKIVTFAVDKYTTYLLVRGVGVVKHLHLFSFPVAAS